MGSLEQKEPTQGLALRLFGPLEITRDGGVVGGFRGLRERWLLARLALVAAPVDRSALAIEFWPGSNDFQALYNLRRSLHDIRQALGADADRIQSPTSRSIYLDMDGAFCDVYAFDAAVVRGTDDALAEAVALYRGHLLEGCPEPWVAPLRAARLEALKEALATLAGRLAERGDHRDAVVHLRRLATLKPTSEKVCTALLKSLGELGEMGAVTEAYRRLRLALREQNAQPSHGLQELYQSLLTRPSMPVPLESLPEPAVKTPDGALPPDSEFYIIRSEDQRFSDAIQRGDCIVLVKGPREIGKTSLLARGLQQARQQGARVFFTDFQKFLAADLDSSATLMRALARQIALSLDLDLPEWSEHLSPADNLERTLRRALRAIDAPRLVWGLDEVDTLFPYSYSSEVFALFRAWHNERALDPDGPLRKLTLVMAYATEAHLFITDLNQSPFNVGTRVTLNDLTLEEIGALNGRFRHALTGADELRRFHTLTGGHPYLSQRGFDAMDRGATLDALEAAADRDDDTPFSGHLRRQLRHLQQEPALAQTLLAVLRGDVASVSRELFFRLRTAGILIGESPESARCRCGLYRTYLGRCLSHA